MKIILKEDVPHLGHSGEVVEVKAGYARNFLLPTKKAVPATTALVRDHAKRIQAARVREERERTDARGLGERVQGLKIVVFHRAAEGSTRLHGSVTAQDLVQAIKEASGLEIDRRSIDLRSPVRSLGNYQVNLKLSRGVTVPIKYSVVDPTHPTEPEAPPAATVAPAPAPEPSPAPEATTQEPAPEPDPEPEPAAEAGAEEATD